MSVYKRIPSDLLVISIWIIMTIIFIDIPMLNDNIARTALGILTVLFIPGYLLTAVLFPRKNDLEIVPRVALSLGLSVAIVPIVGLTLNFIFGIKLVPILITLCLYTIILVLSATYRRNKLSEDERFSISFRDTYKNVVTWLTPRDKKDGILTGILIFTIIAATGMAYFAIATPKMGERFTEFYVLNTSGKADNYQTDIKVNYPTTYLIGVTNHEYIPTGYTMKIVLGEDVLTSKELRLNHNETWRDNIKLIPNKEGTNMKLEFLLFKGNNITEPYRKLYLWVNVMK